VTWVTKPACLTCPMKDGHPSCEGARAAVCALQPHCFACAGNWLEEVVDPACVVVRNRALVPCNLCSTNPICAHLNLARTVVERSNDFLREIVKLVLEPQIEKLKRRALEIYAGPYYRP
jgi:hypothetical protein